MFYVVQRGRKPGIYNLWSDVQEQIVGFKGCKMWKAETLAEAERTWHLSKQIVAPYNDVVFDVKVVETKSPVIVDPRILYLNKWLKRHHLLSLK